MRAPKRVKPYDITAGEKVSYGYYAALEVVFSQFLNELESYFFDEFNSSLSFDYKIVTGLKFKKYLNGLVNPQPIILFSLSPIIGNCLLVMENRSANLLLSREKLRSNKRTAVSNQFGLNAKHASEIQLTIEQLLNRFCGCWEKILPVKSRLQKLVTNTIKARVMSPVEACVVVKVSLRQNRFATYWEFCFSDYQLDQVIKQFGSQLLLAGNGEARANDQTKKYLTDLLLNECQYFIKGIVGEISISEHELIECYQKQKVIPVKNAIESNAIVSINDHPLLFGYIGSTNDQIAIQINGKYDNKTVEQKVKQKSFNKIRFPQL